MDNFADTENKLATDGKSAAVDSPLPSTNRRRFTRNAIVGSAVLLSLSNRAAWGGPGGSNCMSLSTLQSLNPDGSFAASVAIDRPGHSQTDVDAILGANGGGSGTSCIDSTGEVCVYPGNNCPTDTSPWPASASSEIYYPSDNTQTQQSVFFE